LGSVGTFYSMAKMKEFLISRLPIFEARDVLKKKTVPVHKYTLFYYLGGICLYLILLQVVTGILLLIYYSPTEDQAYESVKFIMTQVNFGWLVRSIHAWSANLLILALFIHMFSTLLLRAYRPPREITWMSGMILLLTCMGLGFTGYLLPWNELAYFATKVGTEIVAAVPFIGETIKVFLRGGANVTGITLTRFFALHIWILPLAISAIAGLHLLLVQKHGMSRPLIAKSDSNKTMPFLPHFLLRDFRVWLIFLAILLALSFYFPAHLGEPADSLKPTPIGIKPEWYFLFMFQILKLFPAHILGIEGEHIGIIGLGIIGLLVFLIPFFDKKSARNEPSPVFSVIGWVMVAAFIALTVWGLLD
jgi:cytochrome b6